MAGEGEKKKAEAEDGDDEPNVKRRRTENATETGEADVDSDGEPLLMKVPKIGELVAHPLADPAKAGEGQAKEEELKTAEEYAEEVRKLQEEMLKDEQEETSSSDSESSDTESSSSSSSTTSSEEEDEDLEEALDDKQLDDALAEAGLDAKQLEELDVKELEAEVEAQDVEVAKIEPKEDTAAKKDRQLRVLRQAQLKRDELGALLSDMPAEEHERLVRGAFVSIKVASKAGEEQDSLLAEILSVEPSPPYRIQHGTYKGEERTLEVQLRCKRGRSEKLIKVSSVSNQPISEGEMDQWQKLITKTGMDTELILDALKDRAAEIAQGKHIRYDEAQVTRILRSKPRLEFDAQKQSRMAFEVQCATTQMDISSIKEFEVDELRAREKASEDQLHEMQRKEYQQQDSWFVMRRDLFSLKEINRKNLGRQVRDDRHALIYALKSEEGEGGATTNPFERRACRPVAAWDTKLTEVEALKKKAPEGEEAEAAPSAPKTVEEPAAPAANTNTPATDAAPAATASGGTAARVSGTARVYSVLKAHRRSNLLEQLGSLMAAKAA